MDDVNTTIDTDYTQTVNRNFGTDDPLENFSETTTEATDPNSVRNDADRQANEPGAAGLASAGIGTAIGAVDGEFGQGAGNDIGLVGTGSGSVAGAASSSSGDYYETGPTSDGGWWEHYDDGIHWYYAEYDASGTLVTYEEGYYTTVGMVTTLAFGQTIADEAATSGTPDADEVVAEGYGEGEGSEPVFPSWKLFWGVPNVGLSR